MKYSCTIPCEKEKLKDLREFVQASLNNHDLSEQDISALVIAIDEICANLIIHSHKCNPGHSIELVIKILKDKGIEFNIFDCGEKFDINNYTPPSIEEIIKTRRKGGIGLILVKKIMDEIEFLPGPDQNICRLFKKIRVH
ncbi:MAG: ATP-binding protein [Cyclobacteriaceae bacterium]|nr:ATP-binding protein [Cyclobacteriaceae bacterium]